MPSRWRHATASIGVPGKDRLLPRLAENERVLVTAYDAVTAAATPGQRILPAEAWLLDNFYLIEQQIALARRHLPRGYSRQLPKTGRRSLGRFPAHLRHRSGADLPSGRSRRPGQRHGLLGCLPVRRTAEPGGAVGLPDHAAVGAARERSPRGGAHRPSSRGTGRGHRVGRSHARGRRRRGETAHPRPRGVRGCRRAC